MRKNGVDPAEFWPVALSPLKAVIVDMDGTLYRQSPVRRYTAWKLFQYGLRKPVSAWKTGRALSAFRRAQESLRKVDEPGSAYFQKDRAALDCGYPRAFVSEAVSHWMETVPLPAVALARYPALRDFCVWARARQLDLAVLSDYDPREKLRVLGLSEYFRIVVCAQDDAVGVFKPSPRGLVTILDQLGIAPGEAMYVGDRLDVDGRMAVAAGVAAVILSARPTPHTPGVSFADSWPQVQELVQYRLAAFELQ